MQCYYRRRDIPNALIHLADPSFNDKHPNKTVLDNLTTDDKHSLFHRELFLSRHTEKVPAQYIRGKCTVNLISEVESPHIYINKEDAFFYSLVYDPVNKTLLKDQGEMRVGNRFQAQVQPWIEQPMKLDDDGEYVKLMWDPKNRVSEEDCAKYLIVVRSIGTFSRALHHTTQVRETSLVNSAAAASRDVAIAYAHDLLNMWDYDIGKSCLELVPENGPLLIQDQSEEWSASEAALFEEALDKHGKEFGEIRKEFLPWKTMPSIIEYYYMWKTTDRYMRQKRIKATEAESKLKQVYIPSSGTYNNPNKIPLDGPNGPFVNFQCEGCSCKESNAWFLWGPNNMCKLCESCWVYWKKFGGLKKPTAYEKSANEQNVREFKYECKQCKRQFSRQERLVNHMSEHGEYRCVVEGCDREFKVKNQLYRHLTSTHNLCITSRTSYAQIIKVREPFLMVATKATKRVQQKMTQRFQKIARNPCVEIDISDISSNCESSSESEAHADESKTKTKKVSIEDLVLKIGEVYREAPSGRKRGITDKNNAATAPYKKIHLDVNAPLVSVSSKPFKWCDVVDGYLYMASPETKEKRVKKKSSDYKRASRCPALDVSAENKAN